MKPHEKLGVAIADAGYAWTPEMRSAWEELDRQQDRIAELKKQNEALEQLRPYWAKGFSNDSVAAQCTVSAMSELHKLLGANNQTDAVIKIKQQQKRIAELEKQCEPIAIVNTNCENNIQWYINDIKKYNGYFLFVNAQTKPLSDEAIEEVIRKHWNKEYGNRNMLTLCKAVLEEANK